jgi:hypothetical protein
MPEDNEFIAVVPVKAIICTKPHEAPPVLKDAVHLVVR